MHSLDGGGCRAREQAGREHPRAKRRGGAAGTARAVRCAGVLALLAAPWLSRAQTPADLGVTFNDEGADPDAPLAAEQWHTVTARYRHTGRVDTLTNTYLVFCRGGNPLTGFYIGYNLPRHELAIVKHGYWNATEATGSPGQAGRILENDQGFLDCEHTAVERTADTVTVAYRIRFKAGVLEGPCSVLQYIEDRDVNYAGFEQVGTVTIGRDCAVHRNDWPRGWRNALAPRGKASKRLLLADEGRARYHLLIPAEPARIEQKAAQDLAHYLGLVSGASFAVRREGEASAGGGACISVGRTRLLAGSRCAWKDEELPPEGYAIEVLEDTVYLYGGSGRGLLHGVYALLEEDLGCRWYGLDSVDTPRAPRLRVRLATRKAAPAFELRDPYILRMHDPGWSLRNRTNSPHARIPLAWGGSIRLYHMGHTYARYFPPEKYFAEHPEYYALVNGKRQPAQLCHTNEEVIRLSIEKTCAIFREHPDVAVTAIGPNDGRGFCDCPECRRLDDENGGRSGSYFHMLNRIAEGVRREFPSKRILALAYLDYARPPARLAVDEGIIVHLCTDSHAWRYQFCPVWESDEFAGILQAWQERGATVYLWDYTADYVHYLVPMANWSVVAANTRFYREHGVSGVMYESEANDNDELRAWVWAKQLWDPDLDTKALLRDFIFGYYKEAAEPLWKYQMMLWDYWERWHALPHRCGEPSDNPLLNTLNCSCAPDGPMFTPEFMAGMRECFAAAEAAARSDAIRARVRRARAPLLYLELAQGLGYYSEFGDFIYGRRLREPRAAKEDLRQTLAQFEAVVQENRMVSLGIPITVEKITAKWRAAAELDSPVLPRVDLPAEWLFATDPADRGLAEGWHRDRRFFEAVSRSKGGRYDTAALADTSAGQFARLHTNRGVGWEQQGFPGFDGYGWYFQNVTLPEDVAGRPHVYLFLPRVNEEVWVYGNGELACERTCAALGPGEQIGTPVTADLRPYLAPAGPNRLAIRVRHQYGLGGILAPGTLICTEEACTPEDLVRYLEGWLEK